MEDNTEVSLPNFRRILTTLQAFRDPKIFDTYRQSWRCHLVL